ncbi:MAG: 7-cyano-7-deazaguanine synthase [Candidatus Omnitrophica bacterium]|nr:7-cyano-7-deazaguanine synthase [Candidatus Omnitrophota bacterium]
MNKKAVVLLSGGLDSTLAAKLMLEQGIELEAINFLTTFCTCTKKGCQHEASKVAKELGIKITVENITNEYLEIVKNPKHGYGSGVNPCIDCRIFIFKRAKEFMQRIDASFIITGEVLGERPMSQRRAPLMVIEKESGLQGLILRPLSAKLFEPSIPEKTGVVDREALLAISGRSRKPQIELAKELDLNEYPCPAGGCLLTDPGFSKRAKDLLAHKNFTLDNVFLLKAGRHFRLSKSCKLIVGRNEKENEKISTLADEKDSLMDAKDVPGPIGLLRGEATEDDLSIALRIVARYADKTEGDTVLMEHWASGKDDRSFTEVKPLDKDKLEALRI